MAMEIINICMLSLLNTLLLLLDNTMSQKKKRREKRDVHEKE